MQFGKRMRSILSWGICLVLLMGSFASAARLKVGSGPDRANWVEVCTANGMKLISLAQGGANAPADDEPAAHHLSGHCAWCSSYSAAMGMPPAPMLQWQAPAPIQLLPILFLEAPQPLFVWASAQPRAPPRRV